MKILVVNCGSSSLKYQLIDMDEEKLLAKGNYERIGEDEAFVTHKVNGQSYVINNAVYNHEQALQKVLHLLLNEEYKVINDLSEISAVGHRIVHGGELFDGPALVDDKVVSDIESLIPLAPLHNPAAVMGIKACHSIMPGIPMVVAFDTAFHQTIPEENYLFAVPYEMYKKYGIRRYGAHGISHQYVAKRCAEMMQRPLEELKIVTCHLGQGASICAINTGKSVDTSMGLSPLGGIPMVTRSGDLDPSVITQIMREENLTADELTNLLNKKSGLYGLSGYVPDFREIELASYKPDMPMCTLAIKIFTRSISQYIAKYAVTLNGIDAIVFTGGIGENQINVRKTILENLGWMGVKVDVDSNNVRSVETKISKDDSSISAFIIPTDEEMVIARETKRIVENI